MIEDILETCQELGNKRSVVRSILKTVEEVGELSTEVNICIGNLNKKPSDDGVIGEGVDTIIATIDTMFLLFPDITANEIHGVILTKLNKWKSNP